MVVTMDAKTRAAYAVKSNPLAMRMLGFLLTLRAWVAKQYAKSPVMGTAAFVALTPIITIIGTVLLVIIVVLVLAALAPMFFTAVADLTGAFNTADTNSTIANTILGILAILVPLILVFGFIGLIVYATAFRKKKGGY